MPSSQAMLESQPDAAIVRAILYLGHRFGLEVIAEGVETEEQATRLRRKGCETAQGSCSGNPCRQTSLKDGLYGMAC
jgi:EAL domain-containing protein (putative c-di-GMP-specific phosphodiesterase class I)